jgi:hypothetical protein
VEYWSTQTANFLSKLLDLDKVIPILGFGEQIATSLTEQLHTILIEIAFNSCNNADEFGDEVLTAACLYETALAGGYSQLASELARCTTSGSLGWLFERSTKLAPILNDRASSMLTLGFSMQAEKILSPSARALILARIFAYFNDIPLNPMPESRLVIFDYAEVLLSESLASKHLDRLFKGVAARKGLNLWCIGGSPSAWLASLTGQFVLEQVPQLFFFNQTGPGMIGAAKRLGLPNRVLRAVREMPSGGAVLLTKPNTNEPQLEVFMPVAQAYIARLSQAPLKRPFALPQPFQNQPALSPRLNSFQSLQPEANDFGSPQTNEMLALQTLLASPFPSSTRKGA